MKGHTLTYIPNKDLSRLARYETGTHPLRCEWQDWPTVRRGGDARLCPGLVEWVVVMAPRRRVGWFYVCAGHSTSDWYDRYTKVKLDALEA